MAGLPPWIRHYVRQQTVPLGVLNDECVVGLLGHILFSACIICRCTVAVTEVSAKLNTHISQGTVTRRFRCDGIFNDCFIANFLENVPVKEMFYIVNLITPRALFSPIF